MVDIVGAVPLALWLARATTNRIIRPNLIGAEGRAHGHRPYKELFLYRFQVDRIFCLGYQPPATC